MSDIIANRMVDFRGRLEEMGISDLVKIEKQSKDPNRVNIEVLKDKLLPYQLVQSAVMGLIAHFQNRKWCKDWNYTYIIKGHHCVTFTEESD